MNEIDVGLVVELSIFAKFKATRGEPETYYLPGTPDEIDILKLSMSLGDGTEIELTAEQEQEILARYQHKIEGAILNGRTN